MKKGICSLLLTVIMLVGLFPVSVFATTTTEALPSPWENNGLDEAVVVVDEANAYEGTRAIYVNNTALDANANVYLSTGLVLTAGHSYTLSFYKKGTANDNDVWALPSWFGGDVNAKPLANMSPTTEGLSADKISAGWKKYTYTFTHSDEGYRLRFVFHNHAGNFYMDNVSLIDNTLGDEELITNGGFESTKPVPAFGKHAVSKALPAGVDVLNSQAQCEIAVGSDYAYEGTKAAYVVNEAASGEHGIRLLTETRAAGTYTITFYMRAKSEMNLGSTGAQIEWWFTPLTDFTVTTPENEEKAADGWKKYTATLTAGSADSAYVGLRIRFNDHASAFYVDNISMVRQGTTENILTNVQSTFEDYTSGVEVIDAKFFDGSTEVEALTAEHSGKTLSVKAFVLNYDDTPITAQMLVGLYSGYKLLDVGLSDLNTVAKADGVVEITAEITLPSFTESDIPDLRAYVWESTESLKPLTGVKEI